MKREIKSIALFDDGTQVSNYLKLYFQARSGFSVTRMYSQKDLDHSIKNTSFDIIICPSNSLLGRYSQRSKKNCIVLTWHVVKNPKTGDRLRRHPSFLFEIETNDTVLSYHTSSDESIQDQFTALSRLLVSLNRHHDDFARFQADAGILQSIVDESITGIIYLIQNTIQWVNPETLRLLGMNERELKGRDFSSLFPDKDRYRDFIREISRNRNNDGTGIASCTLVKKYGEGVDCQVRMRRLDPMNSQRGHLVFLEDNQERVHLEHSLGEYQERIARNEEKYLELMQQMNHAIVKTDLNGIITFWNTRAETIFGFPSSEAKGSSLIDLIADPGSRTSKDMAVLLCDAGAADDTSTLHVLENRKKNATRLWVAWNTLLYRNIHGSLAGILWIGQNISDIERDSGNDNLPEPWIHQILKGTDIKEEVFRILFHCAIELGRGGREQKKVGTSIVIGDAEKVMTMSRPLGINAFEGRNPEQRMVQSKGNAENIKNLALLDGAFVINGSGFIHASSRQLLADTSNIRLPEGYGTRHVSVAAMTQVTNSVGIVVSESGGTVTLFKGGTIVKQFAP